MTDFELILNVIRVAEKLKITTRHSWTSDSNRQESVAEHVWMCSFLLILIKDKLSVEFNFEKTLTMIIIHDLSEAITTDTPDFYKKHSKYEEKVELQAFKKIIGNDPNFEYLIQLFEDFLKGDSIESKIAKSIDKLEVQIQHNLADINKTWDHNDYKYALTLNNKYHQFNPFLKDFKNQIDAWTAELVEQNNTSEFLNPDELKTVNRNK